jgi:aminodeoxyfutalosine deaminase
MSEAYRQLRKAELHLHLEGSVEPETLLALDPSLTLDAIRERYQYQGFAGFLASYIWVNRHLRSPADYALITRRLLHSLHAQNVVYAEITLSVGVIIWREQDFEGIYAAIREECEASPVTVFWIFDAIRQFGPEPAVRVAELAKKHRPNGVVAFGIGGDEERGPVDWFKDIFADVKTSGLALVPHAGETVGPESIWGALEAGADRIGHGFRAIEDPVLVRHLAEHDIPLELCISSNVRTGVVSTLAAHPLRQLFEAGVPVTLNTDDPALFQTDLVTEYRLAREQFAFSDEELLEVAQNAFHYAAGQLIPGE